LMRSATRYYVSAVTGVAIVWTYFLYRGAPAAPPSMLSDALILCGLAIAAELLSFLLPRSATGSIGFIPYFAAAIVVASWPAVLGVVLVKASVEVWTRRAPIKAILNVSAHAIMELVAVSVYLALGGQSLRSIPQLLDLTHLTKVAGVPALVAFVAAHLANNIIVTGVIAVSSGKALRHVLQDNHRATLGLDFLAVPLVFVFAWVYAAFGAIAAATCWVPILGLRQVQRTNLELEQTNEELLELMVKSIEARDPYTSGHSRRVRQFSTTIARAIGLSDRQIEHVGRAALLHDVGKIYEKYAGVLSKEDKLTPEEWATIQEHPVDGAELVATMTRLRDLVPAVRHHHENWDGTGYPDRIAGEAIPLASRIIRFADTIDAMTSERPYRRPLTEAQVKSEVIRCRGTQFDPEIADRLLASPLWSSLFAPASNEVSIAPLSVIGRSTARAGRAIGKTRARTV
ncbi:MAG: HD-GYP domain-containing protein, partial [Gemmatimonadaceae bacterium]